jgi:hypothetical protein
MKFKVVVVYENVPESTDIYILEVTKSELEWMAQCHGHFANATDTSEAIEADIDRLFLYLAKCKKETFSAGEPVRIHGDAYLIHTGCLM